MKKTPRGNFQAWHQQNRCATPPALVQRSTEAPSQLAATADQWSNVRMLVTLDQSNTCLKTNGGTLAETEQTNKQTNKRTICTENVTKRGEVIKMN